jgi:hypothetical protein
MSALRRALTTAALQAEVVLLDVNLIMMPVKAAFRHWKSVEPYEFRVPIPEAVFEAACGTCVVRGDWYMLFFLVTSFHCWLRPAEALSLSWPDIVYLWDEVLSVGLVRIGNPKIKFPTPVQHVLMESEGVRAVLHTIWVAVGSPTTGLIFGWSPVQAAKRWDTILKYLHIGEVNMSGQPGAAEALWRRFTLGGLRAGAATADYLRTQNTARTRWRGRWSSDGVLKHYLQLGTYYLSSVKLSGRTQLIVSAERERFHTFVQALLN